jgi:exopolysaccharide biosynthesis polyprenyl glycosylphosphotransferase
MTIVNRGKSLILFVGDILFFYFSLYLTLLIRYQKFPNAETWENHFWPFTILFLASIIVFFIVGLYENKTSFMKNVLPLTIFRTQVVNSVIAVLFFYFIPLFSIAPKTNLFIYLAVSLVIFILWRVFVSDAISPKTKQNTLLIARGDEMQILKEEINNGSYGFDIIHSINLAKTEELDVKRDIIDIVYSEGISTIIIDTKDDTVLPILPHLYNLMFSNIQFVDVHETYEYLFNRVPISLVRHGWFLENVRSKPHLMYDALKRLMDIFISLFVGALSLIFYPFVWLGIRIDDGGKLFYIDERLGKENKKIHIIKFRSMSEGENKRETKFGKFIRKTRIDELPQIWNVLKGDLSLIGPRPEQPSKVEKYNQQISYYNVRHLIKPGLSGWAQIYHDNHPHHEIAVEETKEKLSYDLYYIKNRSLFLDLKIALKTLKTLVLSKGR